MAGEAEVADRPAVGELERRAQRPEVERQRGQGPGEGAGAVGGGSGQPATRPGERVEEQDQPHQADLILERDRQPSEQPGDGHESETRRPCALAHQQGEGPETERGRDRVREVLGSEDHQDRGEAEGDRRGGAVAGLEALGHVSHSEQEQDRRHDGDEQGERPDDRRVCFHRRLHPGGALRVVAVELVGDLVVGLPAGMRRLAGVGRRVGGEIASGPAVDDRKQGQ